MLHKNFDFILYILLSPKLDFFGHLHTIIFYNLVKLHLPIQEEYI